MAKEDIFKDIGNLEESNEADDIFSGLDEAEEEVEQEATQTQTSDAPQNQAQTGSKEDMELTKIFGPIDNDMIFMGRYPIKSVTFKTVMEQDADGNFNPKLDKNGHVIYDKDWLFVAFDIFEEFDPDEPVEKSIGFNRRKLDRDSNEYVDDPEKAAFIDERVKYAFGGYGIDSFDKLARFANPANLEKARKALASNDKFDDDDFSADIYQRSSSFKNDDGETVVRVSFDIINRHRTGGDFIPGVRPTDELFRYMAMEELDKKGLPGEIVAVGNDKKWKRFVIAFKPVIPQEVIDEAGAKEKALIDAVIEGAPYQAAYKYDDGNEGIDSAKRTKNGQIITNALDEATPSAQIKGYNQWEKAIGSIAKFRVDSYDSQRNKGEKTYVSKFK